MNDGFQRDDQAAGGQIHFKNQIILRQEKPAVTADLSWTMREEAVKVGKAVRENDRLALQPTADPHHSEDHYDQNKQ